MKLGRLAEHYYTAAEARKLLGVDPDTFQYWGREGRVTRKYLPGRKHPVYIKQEINDLARKIDAAIIAHDDGLEYRKATLEDMEAERDLAHLAFGEGTLRVPREAFLQKNPDIDYHLYDKGNLVAFINIFPLKHETIEKFMTNQIRGWQIPIDDIEPFAPGKPLECLIMDAVTIPSVPPHKRVAYSARLIANFLKTFSEWGKQGVEITKLYSIGNTPAGRHILRSARFQELGEIAHGRVAFEMDIANSDSKVLREYKKNLEEWKYSNNVKKVKNRTSETGLRKRTK